MLWLTMSDNIETELLQSQDEGRKIPSKLIAFAKAIKKMDENDPQKQIESIKFFDEIEKIPIPFDSNEPSTLEEIRKLCVDYNGDENKGFDIRKIDTFDKVYGAWLGRAAGCLLGKPVEGWKTDKLIPFLKDTNNYPINFYMSSDIDFELIQKYNIAHPDIAFINNVNSMPVDDDMNYTVLGLEIVEKYGKDFTQDDVALAWLLNFSVFDVCTAERIAYKNLINNILPPFSATYRNPYRELQGAFCLHR